MANDSEITPELVEQFLAENMKNDPRQFFRMLRDALGKSLGDIGIISAETSQVAGHWNVFISTFITPSDGEWLADDPKVSIYYNNNVVDGPTSMTSESIFGVPGLWQYQGYGLYPEPNFALLKVTFMNQQYQLTTQTKVITFD